MTSSGNGKPKTIDDVALVMARRFRVVDAEGVAWCVNGCEATATLPTLECAVCVDKRVRGWR